MATSAAVHWKRDGIVVLPEFLAPEDCVRYGALCDRVLGQWRATHPAEADGTNIAQLTEPRYWRDDRDSLVSLLELVAEPRILALLTELAGEPPLFHNTQYFANPPSASWSGSWHRDTQFDHPRDRDERKAMKRFTGVHFRIAFVPDDHLQVVPGSHARFDTPAEKAIRKARDPATRTGDDMRGAQRIALDTGDACLFNAWMIHRGRYRAGTPRRTLDLIYKWGRGDADTTPPPTCFRDPAVLDALSPHARAFFDRFIATYETTW